MRERTAYLDALRCLAIFLVVLLHNDAPVVVNTACYGRPSWYLCMFLDGAVRLGVPLFFMISGCLLLNGTGAAKPAAFYRKKLPRLLAPLAVWNVIYHWTNAWQFHTDTGLLALLQKAFNRGTGYHMWYIYVLLGLYLLCPFLKRMVDGCTPRQLAALAGIILLPAAVLPLVSQMVSWSGARRAIWGVRRSICSPPLPRRSPSHSAEGTPSSTICRPAPCLCGSAPFGSGGMKRSGLSPGPSPGCPSGPSGSTGSIPWCWTW